MDDGDSRNRAFLSEQAQCGGPLSRVPLLRTVEDMSRKALDMGICLHRGSIEESEGDLLAGPFERKGQYMWVPFLDPEDITILSVGAIWNFGKGTGLYRADIRLWGTKGLSIGPRCIRALRARTQCKSINQSINQSINHPCQKRSITHAGQSLELVTPRDTLAHDKSSAGLCAAQGAAGEVDTRMCTLFSNGLHSHVNLRAYSTNSRRGLRYNIKKGQTEGKHLCNESRNYRHSSRRQQADRQTDITSGI